KKDIARKISVSVQDAQELRLVADDAGDGISCDMANWADAHLIRSASAKLSPPAERVNIALSAQVVTFVPNRMDGTHASRIEEFPADDLFLETEIEPRSDGTYIVPQLENGVGCIGLQWLESRRLRELGIQFADENIPSMEGVPVEGWLGPTRWQGEWKKLNGTLETTKNNWIYKLDWRGDKNASLGVQKIRWVIPSVTQLVAIRRLTAFTNSRWKTCDLVLQMEEPLSDKRGSVSMYNGEILTPDDLGTALRWDWSLSVPLQLKIRYCTNKRVKLDRTLLRLQLPTGSFGVAVDDVLNNECVYVRHAGLCVTKASPAWTPDEYRKQIASRKTVLEQVREMPDQTFAQALEKVRNPIQDNGPMMLSLACDNNKFVVQRQGAIRFENPDKSRLVEMRPIYGSGTMDDYQRRLHEGWLPVPIFSVVDRGVVYSQRTYVAPLDKEPLPEGAPWIYEHPLCVAEFTVENSGVEQTDVQLNLGFQVNGEDGLPEVRNVENGAVVENQDQLVASVDASEAPSLKIEARKGAVELRGILAGNAKARCYVYIPSWTVSTDEYKTLHRGPELLRKTETYWREIMAPGMQVDVPDSLLCNVIRASQVHCLLAARNEENGERIAPWIASMAYGPLESESNSVIRGMDFMGHHDFARRSLDYFIHRYNPQGFFTTGYTLMGIGWHLWMLGEHDGLTRDSEWLNGAAPKVTRICDWILRQREKTEKLDAHGERSLEYGLVPPGVMADWSNYAYYFCLNGYYYAGLKSVGVALKRIGVPEAEKFVQNATEFREDILRAYRGCQSLAPVVPLNNGIWVPYYPTQAYCPAPIGDFYPSEDGNRSWCYDVELGAHHLVPLGVLEPEDPVVDWIMDHMEDVQFLRDGWFDYPSEKNHQDWFDFGGFGKVQPYYVRNAEVCALRDDVKPFIRSYFNTIPSLLNCENLSFWEHFHNVGAYNKTHETGYFLHQTRTMLVMERGEDLWLAPFVTNRWLEDGMTVAVRNAPTRFGPVSYRIDSSVAKSLISVTIDPPSRNAPEMLVVRLRHPQQKPMRSVAVNGKAHSDFDIARECVYIPPKPERIVVRVDY
ncbi:MAG: NPCBM/NEW2 domain-containing protein, partial [bacterium]